MPEETKKKRDSFVTGLKTEWSLFWDNIIGDSDEEVALEEDSKDPFVTGKLEKLSLEKVKAITKALSQDRKTLNQQLEFLNRELDVNSTKLDSLRLVGGEQDDTLQKIHELSDLGQALSEKLTKINDRLKIARSVEDQIKTNLKNSSV